MFWRAVPKRKFDPNKHRFRVSSVAENKDNIRAMIDIIARHRPEAKVIFTVSPIPLGATFRPVSSMTANSVSKAILRAALDEVLRELDDDANVHYWPSFEIVNDVFTDVWSMDRLHVRPAVLDFIMTLFEENWCADSAPEISSGERYMQALVATNSLPEALKSACINQDHKAISVLIDEQLGKGRTDIARFMVDAAEIVSERRGGRRQSQIADWADKWRETLAQHEAAAPAP